MKKQLKKQKAETIEDSDSDREESGALVQALREQQKELSNLLKNTQSKQESSLALENNKLMLKLDRL